MIRIILHVDKEWGIGKKNDLMFHLPKDMAFFRSTTKGHVVVMGENTLLSLRIARTLSYPQTQPTNTKAASTFIPWRICIGK